jgi:hypothetical protein
MQLTLTLQYFIYTAISTAIMCIFLAFILRAKLQSWTPRLFISYIISLVISLWIIYFIQKYLISFWNKYLNSMNYNEWMYWLFEELTHIPYLFLEVTITSIFITIIFWFLMINYISERRYLLIWTILFTSFVIVNYWITWTIMNFVSKFI